MKMIRIRKYDNDGDANFTIDERKSMPADFRRALVSQELFRKVIISMAVLLVVSWVGNFGLIFASKLLFCSYLVFRWHIICTYIHWMNVLYVICLFISYVHVLSIISTCTIPLTSTSCLCILIFVLYSCFSYQATRHSRRWLDWHGRAHVGNQIQG